jgi:hypothetical protein
VSPEEHAAKMVKAHPLTAALEVSGHSGQNRPIEGGIELEAAAQCSAQIIDGALGMKRL